MSTVVLAANNFFDNNSKFVASGSGGNAFHITNGHARVRVDTTAAFDGTMSVTAVATAVTFQYESALNVFVDDVFDQVIPFDLSTLNVAKTIAIRGLPVGAHKIEIQVSDVVGSGNTGCYPVSLTFSNGTVATVTSPARRLVTYTDSIGMGEQAGIPQGGLQGRTMGMFQRFRRGGSRFDGVTQLGYAGLQAFQLMANGTEINTWKAEIVTACDGTVENVVAIELGTNDYGVGPWTAAAFQTGMTNALTALKAAVPANTTIYALTTFVLTNTGNNSLGAGNAQSDYDAAIVAAASAAGVNSINCKATGFHVLADLGTYGGDGLIHPGNAGHLADYTALAAIL